MTTRPTDTPKWATTGTIDEPADPKQDAGFLFQEFVPFGWMNWAWNRFGLWAAHLASTASRFTGPDAAIAAPPEAPLVAGDTCIIGDWDSTPGAQIGGNYGGNLLFQGVVALGEFVAFERGGNIEFYARDGSGLVLTIVSTLATVSGFVSNGEFTVMWDSTAVAPTNNVEFYRHLNGAQFARATGAGALVTRCHVGPDNFYVAFDENGAGVDLQRWNFGGALDWSFNHSNGAGASPGVSDVMQWGPFLFLIGSVSGHASGATMRCIESATGRDLTGEGGVGATTQYTRRLWNVVTDPIDPGAAGVRHRQIVSDGKIVVLADPTNNFVEVYSVGDGVLMYLLSVPDGPAGIELDQDNIYATLSILGAPNEGYVYAFSRNERAYMWRFPARGSDAGPEAPVVSSDGFAVFLEAQTATSRSPMIAKHLGPRLAQRVDVLVETVGEGNSLPFQRKII